MKSVTKLLKYLNPYWKWAVLAPLMMTLEVVLDLVQPRMVQRIIDDGIAQLDMAVVVNTGLLMIGYALIGVLGGIGGCVFTELATQGFGADLRSALFRKTQSLSFGNLDELETGQLITRLTNDVTQVREMLAMMLRTMIRTPGMLIGSVAMAILTSPKLAVLLLILTPLVMLVVAWVVKKGFPMFGQVQKKLDNLNTVMQENLAGVRVVKAFVRTDYEEKRFGFTNDDLMDFSIRAERLMSVTHPAMMLAVNMGVVAVVWFGGLQVTYGTLKVGQLIAFINYLGQTLMSLMFVSMLTINLARAKASADRIQEVLESEPEVQNKQGACASFVLQGRVAFEDVTFSYDGDGREPVLQGVDFVAEPGQTVAILGATGSGKSSLVNLIPRFYDVTGGQVTIDGVDVRDVDKAALRRHIGVALQESVLFTGTIRDNIRFGRPDASDDEVVAAAKAAQAHDFITGFEEGYDTLIGQRGVNLSGGQKQRVAIARALLMQPRVLILDDSTSAVDVETEIKIQDALDDLMRDRTSFVIAQRISTVLAADNILVLDHGQIAAQGTHEELLVSSPIYREIYDSQLGNGGSIHVGA